MKDQIEVGKQYVNSLGETITAKELSCNYVIVTAMKNLQDSWEYCIKISDAKKRVVRIS